MSCDCNATIYRGRQSFALLTYPIIIVFVSMDRTLSYWPAPHSHVVITDLCHLQKLQFIIFIHYVYMVHVLMMLNRVQQYRKEGNCDVTLMTSIQ